MCSSFSCRSIIHDLEKDTLVWRWKMEIRSTLRRVTWPEKRLKEKEKGGRGGMKGENGTNKRKREREKAEFTGCQTFPYHVRNQEKPGVFVRFAYFFSFFFFFNDASRKQTATTAPFQLVNRLFFHDGGAEKPSNDHVKRKQLPCARASRRIMRIISRENSLISPRRRERIGGWCNWKRWRDPFNLASIL